MKIPERNADLARYVRFKDIRRAVGFLLWILFWYFGAKLYNERHETYSAARKILGWKFVCLIAGAAVIGLFLSRLFWSLIDRPLRGTVVSNDLSRTYETSKDPGIAGHFFRDYRLNTALTLKLSETRVRRLHFELKYGSYEYYRPGVPVVKLHGLPYPVRTDGKTDAGVICAACGRIYKQNEERCERCGHTLIHPEDAKELGEFFET